MSQGMYRILADATILLHFSFVLFTVFGGLLLFVDRKAAFFHAPAFLWGTFIELSGYPCPLTFLENYFSDKGKAAVYSTGFIEHYIVPLVYPPGLTRNTQLVLGIALFVGNALIYWAAFSKFRRRD